MKSLLLALSVLAVLSTPALAHEDNGEFRDVSVELIEPFTVSVAATLVYPNDGEPAEGATVTAVVEQPGAPASAPVSLAESPPGSYHGELQVSSDGTWVVRLTALSPTATTEATIDVPARPVTSTSEPRTSTSTTSTSSTEVADRGGDDPTPGVDPLVLTIIVAAVVAVGALVVMGVRRRGTRGP